MKELKHYRHQQLVIVDGIMSHLIIRQELVLYNIYIVCLRVCLLVVVLTLLFLYRDCFEMNNNMIVAFVYGSNEKLYKEKANFEDLVHYLEIASFIYLA
jgi:hypothetical protein